MFIKYCGRIIKLFSDYSTFELTDTRIYYTEHRFINFETTDIANDVFALVKHHLIAESVLVDLDEYLVDRIKALQILK